MKNKILNLLIIILIISILIPLRVHATGDLKNYTAEKIVEYVQEYGTSKISLDVLDTWYQTLINSGKIMSTREGIEFIHKIDEIRGERRKEENRLNLHNLDFWKPSTQEGSYEKLSTVTGKILGVIQTVGSVVSVLALVLIGIRYMLASIEQKAKYKETMIGYIVGCIMVFAISNIVSIIYEISIQI